MCSSGEESKLEVTLIGTGGGYGESVIINLGNGDWVVVDSCVDPNNKTSLPLNYLKERGVDIANKLKLIICSHWHDDHIQGISSLLEEAKSSLFCMAQQTDRKKFLLYVGLDQEKLKTERRLTSTYEIRACLDICRKRGSRIISAIQDRTVYTVNENGLNAEVFSLSPSDFIIESFAYEISSMIENFGIPTRSLPYSTPNDKSVVIYIKVNNHTILLGSDLEVNKSNQKGWLCILDTSHTVRGRKASLFKIPHHGSENGYHERVWKELLDPNPIANLSPYNRGGKLPQPEMISLFKNYTENLFTTSIVSSSARAKKRGVRMEKVIREFNQSLAEVKFNYGAVRCTVDINSTDSRWGTELIGGASKL